MNDWARSARRQARPTRTAEGWELALQRAMSIWDGMAGGRQEYNAETGASWYSDAAAAAILSLAVALWRDSSAFMEDGE